MSDYYLELRHIHIAAVFLSGALFFLRGLALNLGAGWPRAKPLRRLSQLIDTVLLASALLLMLAVQQYPFVQAWLTVKLVLLVVYVALGFMAFWRGRSRGQRLLFWLAAMAVFLFIVTVARSHNPLGILAGIA